MSVSSPQKSFTVRGQRGEATFRLGEQLRKAITDVSRVTGPKDQFQTFDGKALKSPRAGFALERLDALGNRETVTVVAGADHRIEAVLILGPGKNDYFTR